MNTKLESCNRSSHDFYITSYVDGNTPLMGRTLYRLCRRCGLTYFLHESLHEWWPLWEKGLAAQPRANEDTAERAVPMTRQ